MYSSQVGGRLRHCATVSLFPKCSHATISYRCSSSRTSKITDLDVATARSYCLNLLKKFDSPSYILQTFIPPSARDAYLSIRAINIEIARIPDLVSNLTVGALRMQFWRDNINGIFSNTPPKEPVAILLHHAIISYQERHRHLSTGAVKGWLAKVINAREKYMDNRPYTSLDALENYAEDTYSTLMYVILAVLPLHSLPVDHLASHIGKATGIATVLRGLPLIAFPPPPNHHSNNTVLGGSAGVSSRSKQGAVPLPLDIMAKYGVKEEEVLRRGAEAPGLKDAVFAVATRANDHLITAREMLKDLQEGRAPGHDFEHEGEEGHQYNEPNPKERSHLDDLERGFGVLMPAIATRLWLERLENADFDVFKPQMRTREWKLPWKAYWAYSRRQL